MVELPPYLRVITGGAKREGFQGCVVRRSKVPASPVPAVRVSVLSSSVARTRITPEDAEQALIRLGQLLPEAGQKVHDLHELPDRRQVLVLLAPLVNGA